MFTIAGGILLAIFLLLVLSGFVLVVRDSFRFVGRFVRANAKLCGGLAMLLLVGLYVGWITRDREVVVSASSPGVKCTGQCVYR